MKNYWNYNGKNLMVSKGNLFKMSVFALLLFVIGQGCKKNDQMPAPLVDETSLEAKFMGLSNLVQVNLVADVNNYDPEFMEPKLVNAWGIAFSDEGEIWVSAADEGLAFIFDAEGVEVDPPVNIPFAGEITGGEPTGAMYNATPKFFIPPANEKSEFIYATENGTIVAAVSGNSYTVADRSAFEAVYKGLAIAKSGGSFYLYATNFKQAKVDVFDEAFNYVSTMPFVDPTMPAGYAPFNIKLIDGYLYVTYAKQLAPDNEDDEAGPGNGYVDIYTVDGAFVKRFASQGSLNSPWGIAQIPGSSKILIGNFGSGTINVFSPDGTFLMNLKSGGVPITIEGLWALTFPGGNLPVNERNRLYFSAGPADESHGLFGYLDPQ